jgi:RNA polymerase sigma-70 factor (ECF subfamily)
MESCERLYRDNRERVQRFLLHLTGDVELARDLVQETFARYLSRYGRDSEQIGLLFTIARNAGLDALRRRRTSPLPEREMADTRPDPEHQLIDRQQLDRLLAAIRRLDDTDRQLIALMATGTFSYREIGRLLDLSETNVKVRVHRARLKLKALMAEGEA